MNRNTLLLVTGVLLFAGLFGLTATAAAADTVEPTDFNYNVSVDPGVENTTNNFTFSANVSQNNNNSDIQNLQVNFSQASGVNASNVAAGDVNISEHDNLTDPGVASVQAGTSNHLLLIGVSNTFTLQNADGNFTVTVDNVSVPNNGTFSSTFEFRDDGTIGAVASHSGAYDIAQEQQQQPAPSPTLNFSNQEPGQTGNVTVENVTSDGVDATILVTTQFGGNTTIIGTTNGTYANESVVVQLGSPIGFPGDHTAHILPTADVSNETMTTGNVSTQTANNVTDSETAYLSVDVGNDGTLAQDTTGDGLLNDINGDGSFDILDIQALFANLNSQSLNIYSPLFDFAGSGDGEVDIFDVQGHYAAMQAFQNAV